MSVYQDHLSAVSKIYYHVPEEHCMYSALYSNCVRACFVSGNVSFSLLHIVDVGASTSAYLRELNKWCFIVQ